MRAILTYHSIEASGSPISVSPEAFESHLETLAAAHVRVVDLATLASLPDTGSSPDTAHAVAITFDDGFTSFATEAWPRLRARGLPATLFVVADRAGTTNAWDAAPGLAIPTLPLLPWDDLAKLASEGLTLGAHGRTHAALPGLESQRLDEEVQGSRDAITSRTGTTPDDFAYPFGELDEPALWAARRAFARAVTTEWRPLAPGDDPHRLPRLDAYYFRDNDRLASFGTPAFRRWLALRGAVRRAGALVRRLAHDPDAETLGTATPPPTMDPGPSEGDASHGRGA